MRLLAVLLLVPHLALAEADHRVPEDHADGTHTEDHSDPGDLHGSDGHTDHAPSEFDDAPLSIETPEDLRALAEIDGDPDTFTADEQVKFAILGQLLGLDAAQPVPE